ncbi:unnamed protein product [Miscanthus lutarioriparius]|uniref:Transmembrane protein n=1 Tax=Miscanthus lutarioriparius TaxID=422564 RepID=A0A811NYU2_9POAL|nr:unnamed protein product [Miscanthus lutarioriparius]
MEKKLYDDLKSNGLSGQNPDEIGDCLLLETMILTHVWWCIELAGVIPLTHSQLPNLNILILVTAFVGTAIAFGCFSGTAIIAKCREYLYLSGLLSSGLSILLWLQFATSIFGHTSSTFVQDEECAGEIRRLEEEAAE